MNEENKRLHLALGRGCYHRITHSYKAEPFHSHWCCKDCPMTWPDDGEKPSVPDYCSDLNLCAEAEKEVIEKVGLNRYAMALLNATHGENQTQEWGTAIVADAADRVTAMIEVLTEK